jgi:hypothetical protein
MKKALFYFSVVVVVDEDQIGCVVKTWHNDTGFHEPKGYKYEVYVRSYNRIVEYPENMIQRYVVSKELSEEEKGWH